MNNTPISKKMRSLSPYFLLAVAVILTHRIISELAFFAGIVGTAWGIITPFFYGFLLAYVMNIPYNAIYKLVGKSKSGFVLKRKKIFSIVGAYLGLGFVIYSVIRLIFPAIYESILFFNYEFQNYVDRITMFFDDLVGMEVFGVEITADGIASVFQDVLQSFNIEAFAGHVNSFIMGVTSVIFTTILALISSIYILVEKEKLKAYTYRLVRAFSTPMALEAIMEFSGRLNRNFKQYIYTQTIDGLILGTIVTIQLYFLGSPFFLLLGIMLGVVNYIPYFGSIIGSIVAVVIIAITQDMNIAFFAAVILFITQQIDGNFIQPRLMSGSFSLSPLLVIISITIGGAIAGILGMIAAIPIVAVLKDLFEGIIVHREWKKLENGERFGRNE
ncbi:MAG: AI-2E family transporter [Defluviitaleaceae bacterium]|nr:AI-2E family transporter [Defluviitaleaceae bacterium]